ncbi:hypothetical protein DFJ73DRAFT_379247 [Zopfochytrium polystomum]|nr:hypothetical protein DFJ73DRAFT_379247 [Zopfochytrium polystomum]
MHRRVRKRVAGEDDDDDDDDDDGDSANEEVLRGGGDRVAESDQSDAAFEDVPGTTRPRANSSRGGRGSEAGSRGAARPRKQTTRPAKRAKSDIFAAAAPAAAARSNLTPSPSPPKPLDQEPSQHSLFSKDALRELEARKAVYQKFGLSFDLLRPAPAATEGSAAANSNNSIRSSTPHKSTVQSPVAPDPDAMRVEAVAIEGNRQPLSYIDQWQIVIENVLEDEAHLLNEEELNFVNAYIGLDEESKELFIKLMMRKPKVERLAKLAFPRISNLSLARDQLTQSNIADGDERQKSLDDWLRLLTKDELLLIAKERKLKIPPASTAADVRAKLSSFSKRQLTFSKKGTLESDTALLSRVTKLIGRTVTLKPAAARTFHKIGRLFVIFGRLREWPENFFLDHIRTNLRSDPVSYVSVAVQKVSITWPTWKDFDDYFNMLLLESEAIYLSNDWELNLDRLFEITESCYEDLQKEIREGSPGHVTGIPWLQMFTKGWIRTRLCEMLCSICTRQKQPEKKKQVLRTLLDQSAFLQRHRGEWYEELAKVLHMEKDFKGAFAVCQRALEDTLVRTGARRMIEHRMSRLADKVPKTNKLLFSLTRVKEVPSRTVIADRIYSAESQRPFWRELESTADGVHVEQFALAWWSRDGWKGFHSENSIVTTLFGLLFWDIIFDDTQPGVFSNPFQDAPLDLATEYFYEARKDAIQARLADIEKGKAEELISAVDDRERPTATRCRGVNWNAFSKEEILEIASGFGSTALSKISSAFCRNYWATSSGVPDLCIYKGGKVKLVEVKGEGDRLSQQQRHWLEFLIECSVDVEVMHIMTESGAKAK